HHVGWIRCSDENLLPRPPVQHCTPKYLVAPGGDSAGPSEAPAVRRGGLHGVGFPANRHVSAAGRAGGRLLATSLVERAASVYVERLHRRLGHSRPLSV